MISGVDAFFEHSDMDRLQDLYDHILTHCQKPSYSLLQVNMKSPYTLNNY